MARPIKIRKLITPHKKVVFKPDVKSGRNGSKVILLPDEYETIKLVDYENMHHTQAAKILGVSRPTLTRTYEKARRKIAESLVELKALDVEEGRTVLGDLWYKCSNCESLFNIPKNGTEPCKCPLCFSKLIGEL